MTITTPRGIIAYAMHKLKENGIYRRTYVQKMLYFILPNDEVNELYEMLPITGPYSGDIQRILLCMEKNPDLMNRWKEEVGIYKDKIDKFIDFIKERGISIENIALLSKIKYIINVCNLKTDEELVKTIKSTKPRLLNCADLINLDEKEIISLKKELEVIDKII